MPTTFELIPVHNDDEAAIIVSFDDIRALFDFVVNPMLRQIPENPIAIAVIVDFPYTVSEEGADCRHIHIFREGYIQFECYVGAQLYQSEFFEFNDITIDGHHEFI